MRNTPPAAWIGRSWIAGASPKLWTANARISSLLAQRVSARVRVPRGFPAGSIASSAVVTGEFQWAHRRYKDNCAAKDDAGKRYFRKGVIFDALRPLSKTSRRRNRIIRPHNRSRAGGGAAPQHQQRTRAAEEGLCHGFLTFPAIRCIC